MSWQVDGVISRWELWVLEFVSWWTCKLTSRYIWWLLGFRELVGQWVDLFYTSYMRWVFILCWHYNILCWHYKGNKIRSIDRKTKSKDNFIASNATRWLWQEVRFVRPRNINKWLQRSLVCPQMRDIRFYQYGNRKYSSPFHCGFKIKNISLQKIVCTRLHHFYRR